MTLNGQLDEFSEYAKVFKEFTNGSKYVLFSLVPKKLKYPTNANKLIGMLRNSGYFSEDNIPHASLIENGCFRIFEWKTQVRDKKIITTQVLVSSRGIQFLNEELEKYNGKRSKL